MNIRKFFSLLVAVCFSQIIFSQTIGDACAFPIDLGGVPDTSSGYITDNRVESWYSFQSIFPVLKITVTNSTSTPGLYNKVVLYKGICGLLTALDSAESFGDTIFTLQRNFMSPAVYYIKVSQPAPCKTCTAPLVTADLRIEQGIEPWCGFDSRNSFLRTTNPGYTIQMTAQDQYIYNYITTHSNIGGPYTIPVVVHVVHYGDGYGSGNNISYDQILWQIAGLNAAFQHDYANYNSESYGHTYGTYGPQDYSSNPQVRFCLAERGRDSALSVIPFFYNTMSADTECGVMRYDLTNPIFSTIPNIDSLESYNITNIADEQTLLDLTRPGTEFPPDMYFNIYLVPELCETVSSVTTCGVIGIGTMGPFNSLTGQMDGVIFRSDVFGDNSVAGNTFNLFAPLQEGKIMDHEAGHYLALYHTFQPDSAQPIGCYGMQLATAVSDQCDRHGDFCCDTPPDSDPIVQPFATVNFLNSCNENYFSVVPASDHRDMNENYMDYSDDDWYNTFTFDQSMRISAMLDVGGPRHSLVTPANLTLTGVSDTGICHCCLLVAHILQDRDTICIGAPVNFLTPFGNAFCASSWLWTFPGGTPSSSTTTSSSVTYSATGLYPVYLLATNGVDTVYDTAFVEVIIPMVTVTQTNTNLTVCEGTHQNIYLRFFGNLPPYSVSICNSSNVVVATMSNIVDDTAIILVPITATDSVFHVCSATNGMGCDVDTIIGTASFSTQICCPNLFKNGDFEDWGIGCNILPATTQQVAVATCNQYNVSYYGVYDPTVGNGGWPIVPGHSTNNGLSMVIDGWATPQITSPPPSHTELWCDSVVIVNSSTYLLQFDYGGNHFSLGNSTFQPFPGDTLILQLKVDGVFIGTPVRVPGCSPNSPWRTFVMDWTSTLPTGIHNVCLCQVALPLSGINFGVGSFDFLIDNLTMMAKDLPVALAGGDTLICPGGIATIGSLLNDTNGLYIWTPNNFVTCDTCFYTTANPDSTYQYILMNLLNGCIARDTVVVQVLNVFAGSDTMICRNDSVALTANITGNAGGYTILWQPGLQTTASITISPTVPTTYIVIVTDTAAGCVASDTVLVSPNLINVALSNAIICAGDSITLTPLVTGNVSGVSYLWLPGNQTTPTISVSPSVPTTYTVVVSDTAGCSDTAFATVTPDIISVSFAGGVICVGDSITMTSLVTGGYPTFTYIWQPSGQTTSSITVSPTTATIFTLTVTDSIGCSAFYQDTVAPSNINVTLANTQYCAGDSATLSPIVTGGFPTFSYNWQPGGQTTSTITVAPSSATTYTVVVTDFYGCSDTAQATVTPNSLSVTVPDKTICSGQSTTLVSIVTGGNPTYTYLWQPGGQTTANIGVVPSNTTTYTLIVTDATGCSDTALATVTVNPAPTVSASASPNPACLNSFIQLQSNATGTGTITYVWQPTTNLNNPNTANPTITAYNGTTITYSVFVTDALGCSAMDSVQITLDPNCCAAQANAPDTLFGSPSVGQYAVNQDLYISGVVTISGTEMLMAPNVSIVVLTGSTLNITGQSHLHACLQMWQGIILRPGATINVNGNSLIEDAYTAINCVSAPGASIQLTNAIFNKNQIAVLAQTWTGALNFSMTRCRITCRQLPANPTITMLTPGFLTGLPQSNLIAPLTAQRAFSGVQFLNGGNITIGAIASPLTNIFDYLDHGIIGVNTNFTVRNNWFQNMLQPCSGPPSCSNNAGTAISANDPGLVVGNPATYNTVQVGGIAAAGNTFINCWRSIDITRYVNITVRFNRINSTSTVISPPNLFNLNGDHGVFIRATYAQVMDVNNNDIRNQARGIHINLTAGGLGYNSINVRDNHLTAANTATTFTTVGIQVDGVSGVFFVTNNFLNVEGDTVLNANTCIQVRNIRNAVRIFSNGELKIRPNPTTTPGPNKSGIFVQNCEAVFIQDNLNIHSIGTALDSNNRNIRGIWVFNCAQSIVCNNWIRQVGQCLVFEGSCHFSTVRLDRFSFAYDGFVLRNSAIIGQQGNITHPIDCQWFSSVINDTYTDGTTNCNLTSPIWVRSSGNWNPTNNITNQTATDIYTPNIIPGFFVAAACGATPPTMLSQQILRQNIAQNQISYSTYPNESRVSNRKRLYRELSTSPSLMIGDTILQNFYANSSISNIGYINIADDEIEQGNSVSASLSNANIVPITSSEWNQQVFNSIFLATLMQGNDTLTAQQMIDLVSIAEQCPNLGGDAVWQARAMIDWMTHSANDYTDSCSGENTRLMGNQLNEDHQSNVYPNPNNGSVTVGYKLPETSQGSFEILDLTGRVILTVKLDSQQSQQVIDLIGLANGPYLYKIIGDGDLIDTGTLIISK